jgi:hypothetical protein
MADCEHSVFGPYLGSRPIPPVPLNAGAVRPDESLCEHRRQFALSSLPPTLVRRGQPELREDPGTRRTKIWEFSTNLHCSIIGTCLSTAELRQTLARLGVARGEWTDHDLHHSGVSLAAKHDQAAKQLHKALDRRHKLAISQFGKARTEAELTTLWRDAVKRGDIPGAYWALLTHHATTPALVRTAFGEVHMLSHLVGAANRADIRRLCELEQRNAELEGKLDRQQQALRQAVVTRDATIRELREALRQRLTDDGPAIRDNTAALRDLIVDIERRLAAEATRRATVERRLNEARVELSREREARQSLQADVAVLRAELVSIEATLRPDDNRT